MQIDDYVEEYTRILKELEKNSIHDPSVVVAILKERAKDRRAKEIEERRKSEPATERQKKYLRDLNIPFPSDVTKREASRLIQETVQKEAKF